MRTEVIEDILASLLQLAEGCSVLYVEDEPDIRTEMTEIQANTKEGKEWLPDTGEAFEAGLDSNPEDAAKTMVDLVRHACVELSGRIFGVGQDFDDLISKAKEIKQNDSYTMRFHR